MTNNKNIIFNQIINKIMDNAMSNRIFDKIKTGKLISNESNMILINDGVEIYFLAYVPNEIKCSTGMYKEISKEDRINLAEEFITLYDFYYLKKLYIDILQDREKHYN